MAPALSGKTALVTGASRGIGAAVALGVARSGANVVINYRSKGARAERVAQEVVRVGRRALLAQADITVAADTERMMNEVRDAFGSLELLILNASGGLEKDKPANYAMRLNRDAQLELLSAALPLMPPGGRVVFVTSHWAHFYGQKPVYPGYKPVAASKRAGEDALRARLPELEARGLSLVVVSGDLIEGTITPKLLERSSPGLIRARRDQAGTLPGVEDFAAAIVAAASDPELTNGATVYVGELD